MAARQAAQHKTEEGPPAIVAKPPVPPVRQLPQNANAAVAGMPSQVAQLALQSNAQAAAIARQRLAAAANLRVPPDAQQAAALLQQRKNFAAHQQQLALAQAAVRNAGMASNMSNPQQSGVLPQAPINGNAPVIKTEQESMTQLNSLQNPKQPFALNMPPVAKRPSNASIQQPSSSPPKAPSAIPPNNTPQRTAQNLQMNDAQQPPVNGPPASQTPRQTPATPQVLPQNTLAGSGPQASAGQQQQGMITTPAQLASYHQGLVNGQQTQMHTLAQGNPGYANAANAGMRPVYPGAGNNYPVNGAVGARPPMLQQQMGMVQMNSMQQQMMQNAYQMNMGGFPPTAQGMHPNMQQQMLQIQQMHQNAAAAVAAGSIYAAASGMNMQASAAQAQAQAQQVAVAFNQSIWARVEAAMPKMNPEALADMVARAPDFVKVMPQWATSNDREKARLTMYHLFKQKLMQDRRQAALNAAVNNQQQQQQQQQQR